MTPVRKATGCIALAAMLAPTIAAQAQPEKVAVFDFQFAKGAPTPPTDDDKARLRKTTEEFRSLLKDTGRYTLISTDPVKEDVAKAADLRSCGGCTDTFGKTLGAEAVFIGEVQKVSNLILNMNVYFKPLKDGAPEKAYSVDLRGNTDESFDRGIKYLVKNQLLDR